jgi:hypothetical protein
MEASLEEHKGTEQKGNRMRKRRIIALVRDAIGFALVLTAVSTGAFAQTQPAPEIDPGSMISGLTLLAGGFMILTNRARRK